MTSRQPWDQFPLPTQADDDDRDTYEGVGRVLTQWEHIEFAFSRLYSIFAGAPDTDIVKKYGEGTIFRERSKKLKESAYSFFVKHPCQDLESKFDGIICVAEKFSDRRNEVAHGVVFPVSTWEFFRDRFTNYAAGTAAFYALIPTYYLAISTMKTMSRHTHIRLSN